MFGFRVVVLIATLVVGATLVIGCYSCLFRRWPSATFFLMSLLVGALCCPWVLLLSSVATLAILEGGLRPPSFLMSLLVGALCCPSLVMQIL